MSDPVSLPFVGGVVKFVLHKDDAIITGEDIFAVLPRKFVKDVFEVAVAMLRTGGLRVDGSSEEAVAFLDKFIGDLGARK